MKSRYINLLLTLTLTVLASSEMTLLYSFYF